MKEGDRGREEKTMRSAFLTLVSAFFFAACSGEARDTDSIITYGRENNSGTYMYFKEHVLGNADFAAEVRTLPGTAAVINAVSKDEGAIGYGGIGYVKGVRAIPVKKDANSPAVPPTLENVVNGSYPISRNLYFYTVGEPTGVAREFIAWVVSAEGQAVCEKVGYYPLPSTAQGSLTANGSKLDGGALTIKGSDTMVIAGQRWAEHFMEKNKGAMIQVTGGGSGTGIAALINGATDICQSSRPMKDKERQQIKEKFGKEAKEIAVAMDGLAIFVHEASSVSSVSLEDLKAIYTGQLTSWKALAAKSK
jgi:ABC-type phosphate transport system substrate-binding protein